MKLEIFGRAGCPYCVRAHALAEQLKAARSDFDFTYTDIIQAGMSKEDLAQRAQKPVTTVPQIFLDNAHIGGCTDFEAYAKAHGWV
ncbi:MAG: GrxA family glutaredoxin [Aeromonas sp.]